jgi:RNA polymerase sigma-70 factor, ECF subfamily
MAPEDNDEMIVRLIGDCQSRLFGYLRGMLCSRELAEEALQETNIVLWRKRSQYDPRLNFVTWACQIAYFEACKAREKRHRRVPVFSEVFLNGIAPELAAAAATAPSLQEKLEECVSELNDRDREMIRRRYAYRADVRTVASSMGCSTHAVYRALQRIHETLFKCIAGKLGEDQWD